MSWTVRVWDPTGATLLTEAENGVLTDQGTLAVEGTLAVRGFDPPIVVPPGSGRVLNLYVRQDALQVPPRGIVQFLIDHVPVFWGPAVITPHPGLPGAGPFDQDRDAIERVTVLGGEQLLKDSVLGSLVFEGTTDVATIAYGVCSHYAHPALTVNQLIGFSPIGATLIAYYAPDMPLYDSLTYLASTVPGGASVWVNAVGRVHFEANTPAGS